MRKNQRKCTHLFIHSSIIFLYFFKDKELTTNDDYRIDNVDYNTKFFMMRAKRPQSGTYTIIAKNQVGEDKAEVRITVLGKPSAPNGPLKVSDVHKHGCKLKWDKPDDDGGTPIDYYQIEKLDPLTGMYELITVHLKYHETFALTIRVTLF